MYIVFEIGILHFLIVWKRSEKLLLNFQMKLLTCIKWSQITRESSI